MPDIAVLSPHVADLIAAGEVVERPASVVKELVENAIDAGARALTVELRRGGSSLIRVSDDGEGMTRENAARAFLRHATSKLRAAAELSSITTMGFRGEALAAIAAVSRVDLITRRRGEDMGSALTFEAGRPTGDSPSGCPEGTTVIVRDLFYNTPARQKFLKRDSTEDAHSQEAVVRAAMGRPDISMRLLRDGTEVLHTPGDGSLLSCLYCLFGAEFSKGLIRVEAERGELMVSGFAGKPEMSRAGRGQQYFMVLGRPVRARLLTAALDEAYRGALMAGRQPVCVLDLTIPPALFDINVHPAKSEIKFSDERAVFDCVYHAVKSALAAPGAVPELRLATPAVARRAAVDTGTPSRHAPGGDRPFAPGAPSGAAARAGENLFSTGAEVSLPGQVFILSAGEPAAATPSGAACGSSPPPENASASSGVLRESVPRYDENPRMTDAPAVGENAPPSWRYIGQALGGFLLVESPDCLWIIDKHAAHERLLYNRLKEGARDVMSQRLISPCIVALPPVELDALAGETGFLESAGFELEMFGPGALAVRAGPCDVDPGDIPALLSELAPLLRDRRRPDVRDEALHAIACKAAVKLGRASSDEDMRALARLVMETPDLRHCPHGRPVAVRLTRGQLARQFGR